MKSPNSNRNTVINTEIMSRGSYFGEEELFISGQKLRCQTVKCLTAECWLLEISLDKIRKMEEEVEFYEILAKAAKTKTIQRLQKIENTSKIRSFWKIKTEDVIASIKLTSAENKTQPISNDLSHSKEK